jgi:anti-sigma factor RsiW
VSDDSEFDSPSGDMACVELVELVTDYLEDALPSGQRPRFLEHLAECDGCGAYLEQLRAVVAVAASSPPEQLSPSAREQALALFRSWAAEPPRA